jgi:hypothetical protein
MKKEDLTFKVPEGTKEVTITQEQNSLVVKFIPEFITEFIEGHFYTHKREGETWVMIARNNQILNPQYYALCIVESDILHINDGCMTVPFELATDEEKALLFSALDKEGYQWNAELKKVEKKRWRAELGKAYWTFNSSGIFQSFDACSSMDDKRYNNGFYFQTSKQSQSAFEKVKELLLTLHS